MTKNEALNRLKMHEPELRQAGLRSLYLFGSTSRGDTRTGLDIDLLCDLQDSDELGLLEFIRLRNRLSDLLDSPIDLVERRVMRPRIYERVAREMIQVF